jgi:predicted Rossmann fold flavoprotein
VVYDAIIIGGGAAGLFCGITAGKRRRRVLIIEHNAEVGRKIIISGGGRCNFTNLEVTADHFVSRNPHFCRSALAGYTPSDFMKLVRKHHIDFYEKKLGQLFCRDSSRQIVEMLLTECRSARVEVRTGCSVANVRHVDPGFEVETSQGVFKAGNLVIACGGLSFPKVGASDLGYRVARQFGHKIVQTRPSLVPLILKEKTYTKLSGIAINAQVSTRKAVFRENILFTHRGLSGPAILQASNYWSPDEPVTIDLLPDTDLDQTFSNARDAKRSVGKVLSEHFPHRVVEIFLGSTASRRMEALSEKDREMITMQLKDWTVHFSATEGWDRAEVTIGGVSTEGLDSKTMASRKVSGLYFIGEVVDVTGWLGGYNFQWAWSSGYAAGMAI